jgi:LPXTG-site transpeptidase (sortase) family protein
VLFTRSPEFNFYLEENAMHKSTGLVRVLIILSLLLLTFIPQSSAYAASFVVESLADTGGTPASCGVGDGCTLRQAINLANASAGTDTITFSLSGTITLTSTLPTISTAMTLDGSGQAVTVSGANSYRILNVAGTGNLSIDNLTIANGHTTGDVTGSSGAGISNSGTINSIANSTFTNNVSSYLGGAIYNNGTITTITDSTFSNNSATYGGGAIHNFNASLTTIAATTFSGNSAESGGALSGYNSTISTISASTFYDNTATSSGGAIDTNSAVLNTIANSTFYHNSAGSNGGAIYAFSISTLANSTIAGNSATGDGGGIHLSATVTNVANTIIADNSAATAGFENCRDHPSLDPTTNLNNLTDSLGCLGFPNTLNPALHLGPLANNGGPTQTIALLATFPTVNPAIDSGDAGTCASAAVNGQDQRGTARPQGAGCDIGAFEFIPPLVTVTAVEMLNGSPLAEGASASGNVDVFVVTFSADLYDPAAGYDTDDVTNPANYHLVQNGGTVIPINFVAYSNGGGGGPFQAHLLVNNSVSLATGTYALTISGTTSITSTAGGTLAGDGTTPGTDFVRNFSITGTGSGDPGNGNSASAASLPKTGFAPGLKTVLPAQPDAYAYADLGDLWLDIPKLGLQMPIVGVPSVAGQWDVSWLGERAGWLEGTAYPTLNGNTVITGHVWDADNNPGLFVNLRQLKYGDRFSIHIKNRVYTYEVRKNYQVRANDFGVLGHSDYDIVTLLTCEGFNLTTGNYLYRRAVQAVLVETQ